MRLFGYYVLHTFKNQLKKLFKTWLLVFIAACLVFGFIIGIGIASVADLVDDEIPEDEVIEETIPEDEALEDEDIPINTEEFLAVTELITGGIVLVILLFTSIGADKNGSAIFLPADVNLLFPSPMKPQSVLLFRLTTQLGVVVASSIYIFFNLPSLVMDAGMGILAVVGVIITWLLTLITGKFIQILLYTVFSTRSHLKKYIKMSIYGFIGVIALGFIAFANLSGLDYYRAAKLFFNGSFSRFIPIWGWLKGIFMFSVEGNLLAFILCSVAAVAGCVVLAVIIWNIKADFYEDAMAQSQETAELIEAAESNKGSFVKRKKDRSERIRRDGFTRGTGASVFFFRSMYNRFRFAYFGIFTKTSITYLILSLAVCGFCRFVVQTSTTLPIILALSVFVFFRTLGNPLAEDTSRDFFRLIPEDSFSKLTFSVLGGIVNCLFDIIPALLVAVIMLPANPFILIAWIPFILSIDFYGTITGAFIDLSIQVSAGKMIKQLVQIMFIYFGLIPDAFIMIMGIIFGISPIAAIAAAFINLVIGLLFLALTPIFIDYKDKGK